MTARGFECPMEEMCVIVKTLTVPAAIFLVRLVVRKSVVLNAVVIDSGLI